VPDKITEVSDNDQLSAPVTERRESEVKCLSQSFSPGTRALLYFAAFELPAAALRHLFCSKEISGAVRFERLTGGGTTTYSAFLPSNLDESSGDAETLITDDKSSPEDHEMTNAQENRNGFMDG